MDPSAFDRLTRLVVASPTRRTLGGVVLGSLAGLLGRTSAEAAPCAKGTKRCGKRCIPKRRCCTNANCRPKGSGRVCRRGRCLCPPSKQRCRNRCIPKAACCRCLPGQVCRQGSCCYPTAEAFQAALAPGGPAVIRLCAGTGYSGNIELQRNVTVIGAGPTSTILDGDATGTVVTVDSGVTAELRGLQLTNGRNSFGGGLFVNPRATATLRGCLVRGNTAPAAGGGGFLSFGTLILIDTVVSGNIGRQGAGGAVSDGREDASTLLLRGATRIEGNTASEWGGGLLVVGALTTVELREDSIVTGNAAAAGHPTSGGGIFNDAAFQGSVRFFDRSRVTANTPNDCTGVTCPS